MDGAGDGNEEEGGWMENGKGGWWWIEVSSIFFN